MDGKERQHWVFRAHVADRAGALTSIASAFSNEGISIDTVVGHGTDERTLVGGSVVLTFYCTEEEKDIMVRKIRRLSKVSASRNTPTTRSRSASPPSLPSPVNSSPAMSPAKTPSSPVNASATPRAGPISSPVPPANSTRSSDALPPKAPSKTSSTPLSDYRNGDLWIAG